MKLFGEELEVMIKALMCFDIQQIFFHTDRRLIARIESVTFYT